MNVLDLSPRDFRGYLREIRSMGTSPEQISRLQRAYRDANSRFSGVLSAARSDERALAQEGRAPIMGGLLSIPQEDARQGLIPQIGGLLSGGARNVEYEGIMPMARSMAAGTARAADAPSAAAAGILPRGDMIGEAMGTAGLAMGGGGLVASKPSGALGSNTFRDAPLEGFEGYLSRVNPSSKRIAAEDRPNLMMGDMYGMLPRNSDVIAERGDITFHRSPDGDYYATAYNPDVGEQDVVGYITDRGDSTELQVVAEMQGQGIGGELQYLFRSENPNAPTGGLTEAGERALERTYDRMFDEGLVSANASKSAGLLSAASAPTLNQVLEARAQQMSLKPQDRIQPREGGARVLDRDYMTSAPSDILPDLSQRYPRNPDAEGTLPKKDRARTLVERKDEISSLLADRIAATGQLDADTRYFYHTDGPIYRAAKAAGLSDQEAASYLNDLGNYVAATSPRTKVEENLRNATLAMAKQSQGIPFREVIGSGTVDPKTGVKGISEKGYPMMTGKGGIHGLLLDDVIERGGMNVDTNPKPSNFGPNIAGNRSGVTVDTHAIRGTLMTLNELDAGSVPEGFILPKFREKYAENPSILTPDMIDDTLASQMVDGKKMQTEYSVFADIWHGAADKLGVSPAEAQSMGWFGFGDETNLGSARKTPVDIFDERLDVTAQALGVSPEDAAKAVFRRQIPLMANASPLGGLLGASGASEEQQRRINRRRNQKGLLQ